MQTIAGRRSRLLILHCLALSACGNPYALRITSVEYRQPQIAGSIEVIGPKLYRREALINERREEVKYYTDKIANIDQVNFTPELMRELTVVSSLSASLGLKIDPAVALKFRRDKETSDIQQEISSLKLQLMLDQLKRDAELMRATLLNQTNPINQNLGTVPTDVVVNTPTATVALTSIAQLVASVDALRAQINAGFGSNVPGLAPTAATASPFDTFNDSATLRGVYNGAKNAASLDELHDLDGAALVRLNLSAAVKPPQERYAATFGQLQMKIERPAFGATEKEVIDLYEKWLSRVSSRLSVARFDKVGKFVGTEPSGSFSALSLASLDLFEIASFDYSISGTACEGVRFGIDLALSNGCSRIMLAVPKVVLDGPVQNLQDVSYADIYRAVSQPFMADLFRATADLASAHKPVLEDCALPASFTAQSVDQHMSVGAIIADARYLQALMAASALVDARARALIHAQANDRAITITANRSELFDAAMKATGLLARIYGRVDVACQATIAQNIVVKTVPLRFLQALQPSDGVRIYEMSPKSRVQILSTVARAAEAINLAASISGEIPGNGIGADGNIAYGRSATGKADALERVPLVVAYAEAGHIDSDTTIGAAAADRPLPLFGWLIGPRTTLDAKHQALRLEQVAASYDLSVDLSVPGAWPYIDIASQSVWAPDWQGRNIPGGTPSPTRINRVGLSPTPHDLDNLTGRLLGTSLVREAVIESVQPGTISACARNVVFELAGDHIWRATEVVIGGRLFDGDDVKVLPDMRGLLIKADKAEFPALAGTSATITALTPYGPARSLLTVTDAKPDGTCKATTPSSPVGTGAAGSATKPKPAKA